MSQSARKTLDLLGTISNAHEPMGLMQLSTATAVDKSTAARSLALLEEMALVHRDAGTRRYDVGPALITLANAVLQRVDMRQAVQASLEHLRDVTGETVSLHIRVGDQRVCIYGVESRHLVRRVLRVGESKSLARGSTGRVLLALAPVDEARELLRSHARDDVELDDVMSELESIREDGYVIANSVTTVGVTAACAPVRIGETQRSAVLAVAGPTQRWTIERAAQFVGDLTATASHLEVFLDEDAMDLWRAAPTEAGGG